MLRIFKRSEFQVIVLAETLQLVRFVEEAEHADQTASWKSGRGSADAYCVTIILRIGTKRKGGDKNVRYTAYF